MHNSMFRCSCGFAKSSMESTVLIIKKNISIAMVNIVKNPLWSAEDEQGQLGSRPQMWLFLKSVLKCMAHVSLFSCTKSSNFHISMLGN